MELHFPALKAKQRKNHNQVIITGSSCLEIRRKETLSVFLDVVPSISSLLETPAVPVFNRTLMVLGRNRDSELIRTLNSAIYQEVSKAIVANNHTGFECDFCHRDFEEFFKATELILSFPSLSVEAPIKREINQLTINDFSRLSNLGLFDEFGTIVRNAHEYKTSTNKNDFIESLLQSTRVRTIDESGKTTTEGSVIEYLQAERRFGDKSYFLLDTNWFVLLPEFDGSLVEKFKKKISKRVQAYGFLPEWTNNETEDQYNAKFHAHHGSLFMHKVFSSNIEMCDALHYDLSTHKLYILHAKDGVGAQMRDLTSQVFLSARIIEEEVRTGITPNIDKLYTLAVKMNRIDPLRLSIDSFRDLFRTNEREYCLLVKGRRDIDKTRFASGDFDSRIAKFSLYEFSGAMAINEWPFSICIL